MNAVEVRSWDDEVDNRCCLICRKPFTTEDKIIHTFANTIHETCLAEYQRRWRATGMFRGTGDLHRDH